MKQTNRIGLEHNIEKWAELFFPSSELFKLRSKGKAGFRITIKWRGEYLIFDVGLGRAIKDFIDQAETVRFRILVDSLFGEKNQYRDT